MIKNYLQKHRNPPFKNSLRNDNTMVHFCFADNIAGEHLIQLSDSSKGLHAYNLDWADGEVAKRKMPTQNPAANVFITPTLSGCCIGVRFEEGEVTVWHRNFGESHPDQMPDDKNYNKADFWILPQGCAGIAGKTKPAVCHYRPNAVFWGEFDRQGWHFYYYEDSTREMYEVSVSGVAILVSPASGNCCEVF